MVRKAVISFVMCVMVLCPGRGLWAAAGIADSPFVYPEYSKKISMDFQDAPLIDVLKIFSKQTNLNLITAADLAGKKITIYLDQVPVEQALEQLLRANSLTYEMQPGTDIYIVKALPQPAEALVTRVYSLRHASVSSAKIQQTLQIVADSAGSGGSSGESGSSSAGSGKSINETDKSENIGISGAVRAILTPKGKLIEDPRTNSMMITDIATNFPEIERTIARLDIPVPKIMIEVEMLEVSKETADKAGIKWGETPMTIYGAQRHHMYPFEKLFETKPGYVYEDSEFVSGLADFSGLSMTINFLRTQTDTKNLARPRIMTLNNEPAQIKIATDEAIGQVIQNTESTGSTGTEAERVSTGVFLTVTPQANVATQEITMAIVPRVILTRAGATFNGTTYRDPEERGTQSLVRVKSGDTIIIGGLMRTDTTKTVTKVPLLGDLPFLGGAFRHKDVSNKDRELIVFITPTIIRDRPIPPGMTAEAQLKLREQEVPARPDRLETIQKDLTTIEQMASPREISRDPALP